MSSYPSTYQLVAFRRAISCTNDHAGRWFDCPFSQTAASDHEREYGIGYRRGSGAPGYMHAWHRRSDGSVVIAAESRREASAMRSRAYDATYSGCDDCGGACDLPLLGSFYA